MRVAAVIVLLLGTAGGAGALSPLAVEVRALAGRYHETPARIDTLRSARAPSNVADWTLKDSRAARQLLDSLPGSS